MAAVGRHNASPRRSDEMREAAKDYEFAIKSMKEQIALLKSKLAASEEALKRYKCNEETELVKELVKLTQKEAQTCLNIAREDLIVKDKNIEQCENELKELGAALRLYEEENSRLAEERDHWVRVAKDWENHYSDQDERLAEVRYYQTRLREVQTELNQIKSGNVVRSGSSDSLRLEEQLKSANKRYQSLVKRCESLEKANSELSQRVQQLAAEKKKYVDRWQSLASRVKSDEKLRTRIKDLEDAGNILSSQLEFAIQMNKDLEDKLIQSEQSRSRDYATVRKALEESRKSALKVRLLTEEHEMLSLMNKEISMRLSRYESSSQRASASPRLEAAITEEREQNKALMAEVERLKDEVAVLRNQLSRSTAVSPNATPRRTKRSTEASLGSLVKSLKEIAESPLRAIRDSDAESEQSGTKAPEKNTVGQLDQMSNRVQALEAERRSLQRKLKSAQAVISGVGGRSATPSSERMEERFWTPGKEKTSRANSPNKSFQEYDVHWL